MVTILENTVRDGSYVVDFQFSVEQSNSIVSGLANHGFKLIEIGHGLGLGVSRHPSIRCAKETDAAYIKGAKQVAGTSKIGVFFIPGIGKLDDIRNAKDCGIDFIRIGANVDCYSEMLEAAQLAKQLDLWVGLNLMKSYAVKSYEFLQIARAIDRWQVGDAIYLVDSAGCMTPEEVTTYIDRTREYVQTGLGFHGHNNLSLAIANTCAAARAGAEFVDSSILGLGRSAGNAQTEILTYLLNAEGLSDQQYDQYKLYDFATDVIQPFIKHAQGIDGESVHIGVSKFHSSYLPLIEATAGEFGVSVRELIKEVSDVDCLDPSEKLIEDVAMEIWKNKHDY